MNTKQVSDRIKLRGLRLFLSEAEAVLRGWRFRYCDHSPQAADLQLPQFTVSDFTTRIKSRPELGEINRNRLFNMQLACRKISGIRLRRGEVFSMRQAIGDPTAENGYKDGPMLLSGELQFSSGGGLCQVSTTLFNAALLAGCRILQKYNHSRDLWGNARFIELGRDAVYAYVLRDLKFQNAGDSDLTITIETDEDKMEMRCRFLSDKEKPFDIRIESEALKEIVIKPKEVPVGSEAVSGWFVRTRRFTESNGIEKITYDKTETYRPTIRKKSR